MTKEHKEELQQAIQEMYDAAAKLNALATDDDYDMYTDVIDEAANVVNEVENTFQVEEGTVIM